MSFIDVASDSGASATGKTIAFFVLSPCPPLLILNNLVGRRRFTAEDTKVLAKAAKETLKPIA